MVIVVRTRVRCKKLIVMAFANEYMDRRRLVKTARNGINLDLEFKGGTQGLSYRIAARCQPFNSVGSGVFNKKPRLHGDRGENVGWRAI